MSSRLGLLLAAQLCLQTQAKDTSVVHTASGPVQGKVEDEINKFLGIPFAQPPVDALRFVNAVPVQPWNTTKKTTEHGNQCPQLPIAGSIMIGHEDCLFLDLYTPEKPVSDKLPVYVWIYGGGYVLGDKYEFGVYDPHAFMKKHNDMIFVAMNYRLGVLGFLSNDAIENEQFSGSLGNQGLLDQVLAMKWIKQNIAAFGGDPDHITIGGESAGAFSVVWHLASPASSGLFSAALMESGTGDSRQFYFRKNESLSFSQAFSMSLNCNGTQAEQLSCMRGKKPSELMSFYDVLARFKDTNYIPQLYPAMPWGAVIDHVTMSDLPTRVIEQGKANNVPLLIGTNQNEGSLFLFFIPSRFPKVDKLFLPVLEHFLPNQTSLDWAAAAYNITAYNKDDKHEAEALLTDYFFKCATRRIARAMAAAGNPVYRYKFTFEGGLITKLMKDCHASELPFVFDNWDTLPLGPDLKQKNMSVIFQHYWRNWIIHHDPNHGGSSSEFPAWPPHDSGDSLLMLDDPPAAGGDDLHCDMWDEISKYEW